VGAKKFGRPSGAVLVSELDEFGADFYVGDAAMIAEACATWRWRDLRSGVSAEGFVGFPTCVHPLDALQLSEAIAGVTGRPEVELSGSGNMAGEEGLWAAEELSRPWVEALAGIPDALVDSVCSRWAQLVREEYDAEWDEPSVAEAFRRVVNLARKAVAGGRSFVTIWQQ
jgi:hypothetical protein